MSVADNGMIATAAPLRDEEELSLREIAGRLVIRTGKKRGEQPGSVSGPAPQLLANVRPRRGSRRSQ
ncbi:hypothetical protein GCM10010211_33780 [Streptomyces albospinus]|uniref:Transposase n=1 Tax=Streptomyces albospinus TaxID=285515 RepID=A0ABQ2V5F6_9ACTN|nr:hypothetical protein GCM10010211_33780 [Streptomyces albospinus]